MKKSELIVQLVDVLSEGLSELEQRQIHIASVIASNIYEKRVSLKMSQQEFAKYMGVSQGLVSAWESGTHNFTVEKLVEIYDKLNLSLDLEEHFFSTSAQQKLPSVKVSYSSHKSISPYSISIYSFSSFLPEQKQVKNFPGRKELLPS